MNATREEIESAIRCEQLTVGRELIRYNALLRAALAGITSCEERLAQLEEASEWLSVANTAEVHQVAKLFAARPVETVHARGDVL